MKELICLPVWKGIDRGEVYSFVCLCFPAILGLSGYDSYVKSDVLIAFQNINLCG